MDQITQNVRRSHWISVINACQNRTDSTTVRQWLSNNGIGYKSYYYWLRKFRKEAYEQMKSDAIPNPSSLAEIPINNDPVERNLIDIGFKADAVIKMNGCVIALSNTASDALCRNIMEGLNHAR